MQQIWKYEVRGGAFEVYMPTFAKVITVQVQDGVPVLWAVVTPEQRDGSLTPTTLRRFVVIMTGEPFSAAGKAYVGTFQAGWLVGHVWEVKG